MTTIKFEIDNEQARRVTLDYLSNRLVMHKQYLPETVIKQYKHVIHDISTLLEYEHAVAQYDRAWPQDQTWHD